MLPIDRGTAQNMCGIVVALLVLTLFVQPLNTMDGHQWIFAGIMLVLGLRTIKTHTQL